jgi:hypothetical protein
VVHCDTAVPPENWNGVGLFENNLFELADKAFALRLVGRRLFDMELVPAA